MEGRFFGLSTIEVRRLVFEHAENNNLPHNNNEEKGLAGKVWLQIFMKRNSELSVCSPANTSAARFNKISVETFKLLGSLMDRYKFPPSNIQNFNEKGTSTYQNNITKRQKATLGALRFAERSTTITAEICFNPRGHSTFTFHH